MRRDKLLRRFCLAALCLSLSGCVSTTSGGKDSLSNQEEAKLNLEMGVRYLDMGMLDVAKQKLEVAYDLDSRNASVNNALAFLHERLGETDNAIYYYRRAIEFNPEDAGPKNNYGRFLCKRNNFEEGIALLEDAASTPLNNRKWLALTNLGLCYLEQKQDKQAERAFRQALQLEPNYAPALLEMQGLSYQNRHYLSARAFLERYLGVAQHTPQTLWIAIQTERALGNEALTEKYRQQLLSAFPESEQAKQVRTAVIR